MGKRRSCCCTLVFSGYLVLVGGGDGSGGGTRVAPRDRDVSARAPDLVCLLAVPPPLHNACSRLDVRRDCDLIHDLKVRQ
jgi:hypothetical protein